ncbi:hypothetical protein I1A_000714 [Pseudomonas fluorescens R124]|uniref:Uncharacterized protein n=1 Tax=Pseudomonas fluorescens R124 TaxID=743713 RepID=A0A7U9CPV5_PSEFL|nr:hypothetical protein I1A_000714 [Pseudomonas fluorescens R124]
MHGEECNQKLARSYYGPSWQRLGLALGEWPPRSQTRLTGALAVFIVAQ